MVTMIRGVREKLFEYTVAFRNLLLDSIVVHFFRAKPAQQVKKSVLVVKLDAIGDFILWLDSASALRRMYPPEKYWLVLLGNALWGELVTAMPLFDEYIPVDRVRFRENVRYRLEVLKSLRRRAWSVAIQPTYSRESMYGDAIIRVCGAVERIGSRGDSSNQSAVVMRISDRWYTRLLPACQNPLMELERNAEFLRAMGMQDFRAGLPVLRSNPKLPHGFEACGYAVVVPGGSRDFKQWPIERFAELCRRLHLVLGCTVIVCGSLSETNLGKRLVEMTIENGADWIEDWTGRTSLIELVAIIKGASLLISNDSSAVHIAASVGTCSFCVVGGGHFGRFVPYRLEKEATGPLPVAISHDMECFGCNFTCARKLGLGAPVMCIDRITVDDVWEKVSESFSKENR